MSLLSYNAIANGSRNKADISADKGEPCLVPRLSLNEGDITPLVITAAIGSV